MYGWRSYSAQGPPPILTTKRDGEPSLFLQCPGHLFRQKKSAKTGGERTNPARILARPSAEQPGRICREKCGRLKRRIGGAVTGIRDSKRYSIT